MLASFFCCLYLITTVGHITKARHLPFLLRCTGVLSVTNLRIIWVCRKKPQVNLSIGLNCVTNIDIKISFSRLLGNAQVCSLAFLFSPFSLYACSSSVIFLQLSHAVRIVGFASSNQDRRWSIRIHLHQPGQKQSSFVYHYPICPCRLRNINALSRVEATRRHYQQQTTDFTAWRRTDSYAAGRVESVQRTG